MNNVATINEKRCEMLARDAVARARKMLGDGWRHVSVEIRWGLVAANILDVVVLGQDETIRADKTLANAAAVTAIARAMVAE
jgi:hypothetical protein